ncbi:MAG TPA: outer membrane protein assembly factor BamA [Polyangiaceae bacterium]|nr:outer membrane protein assembly factor BamA [Polyangiaceae bacterium]
MTALLVLATTAPTFAQDEEESDAEQSAAEPEGDAESEPSEEEPAEGDASEEEPAEGPPADPAEVEPEEEPYEPVEDPDVGLTVARTICHGRRIRRIRIRGTRRVSDDDVLAILRLRPGQGCTDRAITRDAQALWNQNFFDDIVVEGRAVGDNRVDLTFRVRERPAIGRITFEGNDNVEDSDLTEEIDLTEGGILSLTRVRAQIAKIRDKYAEEGYFLVRVGYRLRSMENNQVDVVFEIDEGQQVTVRRVRFVGNTHISDSALNGIMQTSQTGFFSFLVNDDRFNRAHFEEDTTRLQAYYYDQGYLAMRVGTPRVELTPDRRYIDLTVPVIEGPRFRIGRLVVREVDSDGNRVEPLGGRRELREMVSANPGDWFNRTSIAQSLMNVTRRYRDEGYAHVDITPETDLDMERRVVHVAIVVERGPLVRIERINITGNTKTRDSVIRREAQIFEGDLYSQTAAETTRARIQALGYFERVELSEEEGSAPDRIIVNIEIAERATGTFQVGAGFSSIESFILTGQVQQQNLFGNGQSLSLQLQLSGIRQLVQLNFVEPYFFDTQWTFGFDVFKTVRQLSFFTRDSTGGSVTFGHPLGDYRLRLFASFRADYVQIGAATAGIFGNVPTGQVQQLFPQLPLQNLFRAGLTNSLRLTLTWDGRNNRLQPTEGFYASWSTEISDEYIGSERNNTFIRHGLDVRGYYPLFEGIVFRARGVWGLVTSRLETGVPVYERYFLGGIFNVRGFPLNSLGPRLGISRDRDPNGIPSDRGVPIGGNMQFFYNFELEFPIVQEVGIRGVIFTDGGNAWNLNGQYCDGAPSAVGVDANDPCQFNPLDIRTSWGFGIRWVSPLGPLRFEWGIPFDRQQQLSEQDIDFQFTIGNFF